MKKKPNPRWFNSEIRHTLNRLRTARRKEPTTANVSKVTALQSHLNSLIVSAKSNYEHYLSSLPIQKIFSYIRSLSPSHSIPAIVSLDSNTVSAESDKANLFNTYFHSIFTRSSYKIPPLEGLPSPTHTLSDIGISEMDVYEALNSLDISKAMGIDGIGPKVLKHCAVALYEPLHHLFLLCLSQCSLPSEWRVHLIVPVFKSGDRSSVRNYRPISLLCTVSKLLEKLIYDKIISFVSTSISTCQFGFRPNHSATQQLLAFFSIIHDSLTTCSQADVIYLDFKKAFDSVPHNELLVKLWLFGVRGNLWKWFKSYLSYRSQCVRLCHCSSDLLPVLSGVPQGSILGPLLFLIYVNDLPLSLKFSNIFMYADDTKCLKKISSTADCLSLQDDLNELNTWCLKWNLQFNEHKCVLLRFCRNHPGKVFDYRINNHPIESLSCHRDLGIIISEDMKWNSHLKYISARAYKVLGLIRRCFSTALSIPTKRNLYLSLVRSQLLYGSQVWRPHLIKDFTDLERVQKRATKYILNDSSSSYKSRLVALNILPLMMQLEFLDIIFFIRCIKEPDLTQAFPIKSYVIFSDNKTRSATHLKLRHSISKLNVTGHFYFNRLPRLWNSLPPLNLNLSLHSLKKQIWKFFWCHFLLHFQSNNPCTFHFCCPCSRCVLSSVHTNYSL